MTLSAGDPRDTVSAYVEMWNERAYAEIPDRVSESFVMHDPGATPDQLPGPTREVHGQQGLRQFIELVTTGFPDFEVTISELTTTDDAVIYEGQITATHEGPYDGLPATGRQVDVPQMSKCTLEDGRIDEHRAYFDQMLVYEQLGLTFPDVLQEAPKLALDKLRRTL